MTKQQALQKFHSTPLNWSSINSFRYDKVRWYKSFILGEREKSKYLDLGTYIDKKIQNDLTFLPTLPRYELMQHKMKIMFDGLELRGIPDGINVKKEKILADYKSGKHAWTKKRTFEHGQFLFYLLLIYVTMKIKPEEFKCRIHWIPTEDRGDFSVGMIKDAGFKTFECVHTMADILKFGAYIKETYKEMEKYLSTQ